MSSLQYKEEPLQSFHLTFQVSSFVTHHLILFPVKSYKTFSTAAWYRITEVHTHITQSTTNSIVKCRLTLCSLLLCIQMFHEPGQHSLYSDYAMGWKSQGLDPGKEKRFFSFPKHPDQLWNPPRLLLNVYLGYFLVVN